MIAQASLVAKAVLALLVVMSIASWGMMIQKCIALNAANHKALSGTEGFEKAANLREAVQSLGSDPASPLYYIAHQGVLEFNRSKELGNSSEVVVDNVRRSLRQGVASELSRLQSSLSLLATTANTAPFIGLFGTVWGIMSSFHSIGLLKSASLATVAPGISEALVATAIGLAVARSGYGGLQRLHGQALSGGHPAGQLRGRLPEPRPARAQRPAPRAAHGQYGALRWAPTWATATSSFLKSTSRPLWT